MRVKQPLISIITAVDPSRIDFFSETIASVSEAMFLAPSLEWIVQVDGKDADCAKEALKASAKIEANLVHCGPGATRNFALERASGMYVRNLDADDVLIPQAFVAFSAFLRRYDFPAWAVTAAADMQGGNTTTGRKDLVRGPVVPARELLRLWTDKLPVHPTTLCIQSDIARALGGWMGLPASEDTGLLMAASSLYDGCYLETPTVRYRISPIQMSSTEGWGKPGKSLKTRHSLIRRRAECIERVMAPVDR